MATKKTCSKCHKELGLEFFYKRKISKDGLRGNCKKCEKSYGNSWYEKGLWREAQLKAKYNLTTALLLKILEDQNNSCAICSKKLIYPDKNTHVDHDHNTGKVRGILCHTCNTGLGKLGDRIETLEKALNYLKGIK